MTSPQTICSRLMFMAMELRGEADRHPAGAVKAQLMNASNSCIYAHRAPYSPDPEVRADALLRLGEAIDLMATAVTKRTERLLEQGVTP